MNDAEKELVFRALHNLGRLADALERLASAMEEKNIRGTDEPDVVVGDEAAGD